MPVASPEQALPEAVPMAAVIEEAIPMAAVDVGVAAAPIAVAEVRSSSRASDGCCRSGGATCDSHRGSGGRGESRTSATSRAGCTRR